MVFNKKKEISNAIFYISRSLPTNLNLRFNPTIVVIILNSAGLY